MSFSNRGCAGFFAKTKEPGTDKSFSFAICYKLAKFHWQTVFASQVIQ